MRIKILFVLIPLILFSSCLEAVNLQDRAIVQAIGIDYKENEFLVTMQIFSSESNTAENFIDPSKQNSKVITCSGKTIQDAIKKTSISQGKEFFLGHNRLIILGNSALSLPLNELFSYFTSATDSRKDVKLLISEEDASSILNADINQGILPALTIEKIVENAYNDSKITKTFLLDLLKKDNVIIPLIKPLTNPNEKSLKTISLTGSALFTDNIYKDKLSFDETTGAIFMLDWLKTASYSLKTKEFKELSVEIYQSKTKIKDNTAKIFAKARIVDFILNDQMEINEEALISAEKEIEKQITLQCKKALIKGKNQNFKPFDDITLQNVTVNILRKGMRKK